MRCARIVTGATTVTIVEDITKFGGRRSDEAAFPIFELERPTTIMETEEEVTMVDVLEQQAAIEEDAHAVLGGSDDRECTYKRGYVKRQALYACLTCIEPGSRAGVCLACSLSCHDRHELVELYTKRNFRCDCGGPAFGEKACSFNGKRTEPNDRNLYDHNFSGLYCKCNRPYPDPEAPDDDEMIQCIVCEDWLHSAHLGTELPPHDGYAEMTCADCVDKNPFLRDYAPAENAPDADASVRSEADKTETEIDVEVSDPTEKPPARVSDESKTEPETAFAEPEAALSEPETASTEPKSASTDPETASIVSTPSVSENGKRKLEDNLSNEAVPEKKAKIEETSECKRPKGAIGQTAGPIFWPSDWRGKLCACSVCLETYKSHDVSFLLDVEDTVMHYENLGKLKTASSGSQYEKGLEALSSLDRVHQINAITEYNKMKEKLLEFLKTFKDKREVVREEDIKDFFAGMKPKREPDGVYFCR